jgi:hypothetical protein
LNGFDIVGQIATLKKAQFPGKYIVKRFLAFQVLGLRMNYFAFPEIDKTTFSSAANTHLACDPPYTKQLNYVRKAGVCYGTVESSGTNLIHKLSDSTPLSYYPKTTHAARHRYSGSVLHNQAHSPGRTASNLLSFWSASRDNGIEKFVRVFIVLDLQSESNRCA